MLLDFPNLLVLDHAGLQILLEAFHVVDFLSEVLLFLLVLLVLGLDPLGDRCLDLFLKQLLHLLDFFFS